MRAKPQSMKGSAMLRPILFALTLAALLIFGGIAAGLPGAIGGLFELVRTGAMGYGSALVMPSTSGPSLASGSIGSSSSGRT